jgi:hypothetical protein
MLGTPVGYPIGGVEPAGSTTVLVATFGSFTLTGEAATFQTQCVAAVGSFSESGEAATLQDTLAAFGAIPASASSGSNAIGSPVGYPLGGGAPATVNFTLTGQDAGLFPSAVTGFFTLTGESVAFDPAEAAAFGSFVLTGGPFTFLSYDIAPGVPGSSIAGSTFTRGRWRALVAELAAEAQARQAAREAARRAAELAAQQATEARRAALAAARAEADAANAAAAQARALIDACSAFDRATQTSEAVRRSLAARASAAQAYALASADEDDAIALLLAA